jgi:hypothetical protein
VPPAVFEGGGDCWCVVWETSKKGTGYVRYTYDGEEKTVYDELGGLVRDDDTVHRVFVPKEELRNNDYVVGSQYVGFKFAYDAIKGETVESEKIRFGGEEKRDGIEILCVSDIRGQRLLLEQAVKKLTFKPDLIVLNGDIASGMETKKDFSGVLVKTAAALSGGEIPVAFARGDCEASGEFASRLWEYLPSTTDGLYYTFEFGALSAAVLDTANDKEDPHGLTDLSAYVGRESKWAESLRADDFGGRYKLVFSHIPSLDDLFGHDLISPFAALGFDAQISGHTKIAARLDGAMPVFTDGGRAGAGCTVTRLSLSGGSIGVIAYDSAGETVFSDTVTVG